MGVSVDQAGEYRGFAQIDYGRARGNADLGLGSDFGDTVTVQENHLFRQHAACFAVEEAACFYRYRLWGWRALVYASIGAAAWCGSGSSPVGYRRLGTEQACDK